MRLGLISDIHGNLSALDLVLAELEVEQVDNIVCLGDLAVMGPQPNEVISRLRQNQIPVVCGNTDIWLVSNHPISSQPPETIESIELTDWAKRRVSDSNRAFLRKLPLSFRMPLAFGRDLLCFHGSPDSVDDITTGPVDGVGEMPERFLAAGHTHVQELRRFGDSVYVNPGSVGLPGVGPGAPGLAVNRDVAWAEYAVLDDRAGRTEVSLRRIPVDVERMWAEVQRAGMPSADWWRSRWAS